MRLTNRTYDLLKWFVLVVLPAVAVLFQGLGELYSYADVEILVSTINLFAVFLGTILQISSKYYNGGDGNGHSAVVA
ncbi:MAG: phage holin [Ruoffia tabacinasalis]|uniref:Holin n=1 Tax=Ruoffia tabacinasalis TaxID=87458 RepID=A0A5R9DVB8_9LACT|nr:phage holin [Ruoffia tabacinasalis]TLQ39935.1 holin [Ruoffia tabacinasalis]